MANSFLGEASVTAEGQEWTLRCDFNAMIAFEDATGRDAMKAFEEAETGNVNMKDLRHMMHAFLQHHHPKATLADAGCVLSTDIDAVGRVIEAASPQTDDLGDEGAGGNVKAVDPAA